MSMREMLGKLSHGRSIVVVVILTVAAGGYAASRILLGPQLAVYQVARTDLVQTVVASGRVETPLRVEIGSQITGAVASIPVAEGQSVKAGQILIALESSEATAAVEQARAAVTQAHARRQQLRELGLPVAQQVQRQAETTLQNARRQFERSGELRAKGFVGQSQLDDAQRNLVIAQSQWEAAKFQARSVGERGSDTLLAEAAVEQAQATLQMGRAKLAYTRIAAPVDGVLIARHVERGYVVQPGKVLMVLSPAGKTQLVVQIDEKNLALLKLGQQALASADAYPAQRFAAELAYINPAVDPQRGALEVKFDVPAPPSYLRQDMTVSVDIEVARRANAVSVPLEILRDSAGPTPWVMKVVAGRLQRQPVKTGVRGGGKAEILEGLQPGDQLVSVTATQLEEGARVRPVAGGRKAGGE